jgi:hypothetical protein
MNLYGSDLFGRPREWLSDEEEDASTRPGIRPPPRRFTDDDADREEEDEATNAAREEEASELMRRLLLLLLLLLCESLSLSVFVASSRSRFEKKIFRIF